jgi:DNA-binding GntR family transcriptional regulator
VKRRDYMKNAESIAYESIIGMILSRNCAPGDRLVETELAESLGLSRTPIRNVLRQLVAEGLLEARGNKGCYIPHLSPEDMASVFKTRALLEGRAAMEAAYCRTDEDVEMLGSLLAEEKQKYSEDKRKEYAAVNNKFHLLLAKLSRNAYIERFVKQVFWRSGLYTFYFDRFYVPPSPIELPRDPSKSISCNEHEQIVRAIAIGDGSLAENVMRNHIYTSYSRIAGRIPAGQSAGIFTARNPFNLMS